MPFQSEKQRRYLWANEPEIARDWTETYGNRISKDDGGIMHQFENYAHEDGGNVSVPRSFQARPHSDQVNLAYITPREAGILQSLKPGTPHRGPMEVPNYDSFDAAGGYSNPDTGYSASSGGGGGGWQDTSRADQRVNERAEQVRRNYVNKENIRSSPLHQRYKPNRIGGQSNWQKFNPLRLLGGFFGNVGRIGSGIMGLGSDWASNMRGGMTQREWEEAKQERIANKRIQNILGRKAPITEMTQKNLAKLGYTGEMPGVGSTRTSRAIDKDYTIDDTLREYPITSNRISEIQTPQGIEETAVYDDYNFPGQSGFISEADYNAQPKFNFNEGPEVLPVNAQFTGNLEDYQRGLVQNVGFNKEQKEYLDAIHKRNTQVDNTGFSQDFRSARDPSKSAGAFFSYESPQDVLANVMRMNPKSTGMFSNTLDPGKIVAGDTSTFASPEEIRSYIKNLSPQDETYYYGMTGNQPNVDYSILPGVATGGLIRQGYKTGGLASLWPR